MALLIFPVLTVAIVTTQDVTVENSEEAINFNVRITSAMPVDGFDQGSPTVGIEFPIDEMNTAGILIMCVHIYDRYFVQTYMCSAV